MDPISALPLDASVTAARALLVLHSPLVISALQWAAFGQLQTSAKMSSAHLARSMVIASFLVALPSKLAPLVFLRLLMVFNVNGICKHSHVTLVATATLLMFPLHVSNKGEPALPLLVPLVAELASLWLVTHLVLLIQQSSLQSSRPLLALLVLLARPALLLMVSAFGISRLDALALKTIFASLPVFVKRLSVLLAQP